jgi:hypothetical protein
MLNCSKYNDFQILDRLKSKIENTNGSSLLPSYRQFGLKQPNPGESDWSLFEILKDQIPKTENVASISEKTEINPLLDQQDKNKSETSTEAPLRKESTSKKHEAKSTLKVIQPLQETYEFCSGVNAK